ncbi:NAD-dependent succinate-semialdehyde dehydrogenase [Burkholderia pseudomultivorans]|uniref:Succinate-semialdehyde dehydrogenase (NADP(+)) GabD n=1 Tax=Burkholderia pseudomultivorans TaxID=1207504 RepID=A0ABU2DZX0_9BURK|nr:NAD-dependent succinate-semialdehyde dehydrogenase [Burkholderia pseudomultivorans]MDR8726812.1 Succinate-semialdehyde dehydrogenase (NADP(+)) GabD [Burkholderia pseudomultivorans]MDR8736083.1 Succinate-semialdehyde dehydrogenase (NADP(+)) GabD [Burkholderia pseudomultivorans]MDR8742059.1 Succinate-semialdehyde dehydrogenase (NADP(+)) GabD [Burkholderia pseudomultivorans]MDR8753142.1 Succinate-semialdehyde dehydrogenase (NADP(+)) GabD [Burkholderia pseudomultivorans]MDR8778653.1 Succinate-s
MLPGHPVLFKSTCYVDGRWIHSDSAATIAVVNPADQTVIGHVPMLERTQIVAAVDAAQRAYETWRWTPQHTRSAAVLRWHALILRHLDDLAALLSLEQGKPLAESRGEIRYAASFVEWFANEAKRVAGRTIPTHIDGAHLGTVMEPVGVAALITPWNFPVAMITRKAAAAIAAGCATVVKPAHETPFSALALAQLADEAGLPAGVFNVVIGEPQMAMETLVGDARVRAVSFTGSTRVGRLVTEAAARAGIRKLALELGGNAPFIVTEDADLERAVEVAVGAKFQTSGQDCCAANRIFVARPLYEAFVARYAEAVRALRTGPAFEPDVDVGPLMHQAAFDATVARVDDARARGARIVAGGRPHRLGGWFFEPTVIADAAPGMRVYDEENFAPISAVCAFDTLDEVVAKANDTEYGLAAYVCATRIDTIFQLVRRLDFAMVSVNGVKFTGAPIPFGGMKASGLGREGGAEGFEPFVETKYFCLGNLGLPVAATA